MVPFLRQATQPYFTQMLSSFRDNCIEETDA